MIEVQEVWTVTCWVLRLNLKACIMCSVNLYFPTSICGTQGPKLSLWSINRKWLLLKHLTIYVNYISSVELFVFMLGFWLLERNRTKNSTSYFLVSPCYYRVFVYLIQLKMAFAQFISNCSAKRRWDWITSRSSWYNTSFGCILNSCQCADTAATFASSLVLIPSKCPMLPGSCNVFWTYAIRPSTAMQPV